MMVLAANYFMIAVMASSNPPKTASLPGLLQQELAE
jgi:hypothetical protein